MRSSAGFIQKRRSFSSESVKFIEERAHLFSDANLAVQEWKVMISAADPNSLGPSSSDCHKLLKN
jgi:hypothetical protein